MVPLPAEFLARLQRGRLDATSTTRAARRASCAYVVERSDAARGPRRATTCLPRARARSCACRRATRRDRDAREARVGALPPREESLMLSAGDDADRDARRSSPAAPRRTTRAGACSRRRASAARCPRSSTTCSAGERIWLDDGKIGGVDRAPSSAKRIQIRITQARAGGVKLRGDKGINLPDSRLSLSALTAKDLADLPFVVAHADMVVRNRVHVADRQPVVLLLTVPGGS